MSARLIKKFGREYTVTRKVSGSYVGGKWVTTGENETFTIIAVKSPVKTNELQILPEGTRIDSVWKLTTQTILRTNMPATATETAKSADIVTIDEKKYQVLHPLDYSTGSKVISLSGYEVIVQLLEEQT